MNVRFALVDDSHSTGPSKYRSTYSHNELREVELFIDLNKIDEHGNGEALIHTSPPYLTTTDSEGLGNVNQGVLRSLDEIVL